MIRFKDICFRSLNDFTLELPIDSPLALIGGSRSGIHEIAQLLIHNETLSQGEVINCPEKALLISHETQQLFYEEQLKQDETDITDELDFGTSALNLINCEEAKQDELKHWAVRLNLSHCLERGYRLLSTGESRKVLLLKAIFEQPDMILLENPFDGLDKDSCESLLALCDCYNKCIQFVFVLNQLSDIPDTLTQVLFFHKGQMLKQNTAKEIKLSSEIQALFTFNHELLSDWPSPPSSHQPLELDTLVEMRKCQVRYLGVKQFSKLDWNLDKGQHTLITGPNGAGKSTLLNLITGDHPQCYSNDMTVLGITRGNGASIWDIKKHIGIISPGLHRDYRAPGNAVTVVVSGLYDSIGLYRKTSQFETNLAKQWLKIMGLESIANHNFRRLSFGQQRLVLIARAMIKQPALLILDEPTQGLDDLDRHRILAIMEILAQQSVTTLVFVSHREDEFINTFKQRLHFQPTTNKPFRFLIQQQQL